MNPIIVLAKKELQEGLRNRWVVATILLLGSVALGLSTLGSLPTGTVGASALELSVVNLASLSVYLLPLIALMLSFDALVGEFERGTMLLLLTYPVARWQVVAGKFLGHLAILASAILLGYGGVALWVAFSSDGGGEGWQAYLLMMGTSLILGAAFIACGYLISVSVQERATAVGVAVGLWLSFVVLYDLALLGLLVLDEQQVVSSQLLSILMMANPTDVYRVLNLTAVEGVSKLVGFGQSASELYIGHFTMLAILVAWVAIPLISAGALLQRREL